MNSELSPLGGGGANFDLCKNVVLHFPTESPTLVSIMAPHMTSGEGRLENPV